MGAPKVSVPAPSAEEKALQSEQANLLKQQSEILKQQQQQQAILLPFIGEQMGFDIQVDDHGNITGVTERDPAGTERRSEIQKLQEERSLAALKGDLPVDPNLERSLAEQEQTLKDRLERQFGPGYETSSPGIETLDKFMQSAEGLRYGARTGAMTLAEQLSLARGASNVSTGGASSFSGATLGQTLGLQGAYGQAAAGYGAAQQPFQFQRGMQFQGNVQNASSQMAWLSGIGQLAGQGASAALMFSDEVLKENIVRVGETLWGAGIYTYNLKGDPTPRMGLMAAEVAELRPEAVGERDGFLTVDYGAL